MARNRLVGEVTHYVYGAANSEIALALEAAKGIFYRDYRPQVCARTQTAGR